MYGAIIIGLGVLVAGIGIQKFVIVLNKRQRKEVKQLYGNYFDPDIFSPEYSIASFIESDYPVFSMSGKNVLWALSEDYKPCIVAYDKSQMLVCKAELRGGNIHLRGSPAEVIDLTVPCVESVWLLRQSDEKPVFEVDILYSRDGETKELKIIRFAVDVDGGRNYHKFRSFIETIKSAGMKNGLVIRNLIR